MLYGQSQPVSVSESKLQWKPIKQTSYLAKLNNFAAEHSSQYPFENSFETVNTQQQSCGPFMNQQNMMGNRYQQKNTWSDKKHNSFATHQLHTQFQNISETPAHPCSSNKLSNFRNEVNKMQRYVSDLQDVQQTRFNDFSQNQISVQNQSKHGCLINLDNEQNFEGSNKLNQNISSISSVASTNENSSSDVEIIEDDYAQNGMPVPGLYHAKSEMIYHQHTTDCVNHHHHHNHNHHHHHHHNHMPISKMHSTYTSFQKSNDNFDDVSSFTGEATRATQKKKFVNREERFEFNQKIEKMKKTEMCRNILMYQHCKYGDSCSYAHNMDELVPKQHLPSNYKTKLCTEYHDQGYCQYGQRCQFLHSIYDLTDKTNLSYQRGLKEEARLTWQRIQQGSDCILVNLLKGKGCVAPEERLPIFEQMYNKDDYKAELLKKDQEKQMKGFSNSYGNFDRQSFSNQYTNNKQTNTFQQYAYQQRKSEPWTNKQFANNSWEQRQYFDNGYNKSNYRRFNTYKFQDTR